MHTTLTADDLTALSGVGHARANQILAAIEKTDVSSEPALATVLGLLKGVTPKTAKYAAEMVFERKRYEDEEEERERAALEHALGRVTKTRNEGLPGLRVEPKPRTVTITAATHIAITFNEDGVLTLEVSDPGDAIEIGLALISEARKELGHVA